jgi:hypothetical protein
MNRLATYALLAACAFGVQIVQSGHASAAGGCGPDMVYSSSMGQCIPKSAGAETKVIIPHGCPQNLDKVCMRAQGGTLTRCHCVS